MSRANIKSVRQIRANESLQFRKTILKGAGNSAYAQEIMTGMTEQTNVQYEERLAKLNKAKSKSKNATKVNSHKFEWTKEHEQLNKNANTVERDLMTMVGRLLVETALEGLFVDVSDEMLAAATERKSQEELLVSQLGDMKAMVGQVNRKQKQRGQNQGLKQGQASKQPRQTSSASLRASRSTSVLPTAAPGAAIGGMSDDLDEPVDTPPPMEGGATEAGPGSVPELVPSVRPQSADSPSKPSGGNHVSKHSGSGGEAAGIMAQLFLQVHQSQEQQWDQLSKHATQLQDEVTADRRRILSELRTNGSDSLAKEITTVIHMIDGDDPETELFIEETIQKLHSIITTHRDMLGLLNEQLQYVHTKHGTIAQERCGGWARSDHEMFVKIFKRAELAGTSRKILAEQFRQQLAHLPYDVVAGHEEWYREIKLIQGKKHELVQTHEQSLAGLIMNAKTDLAHFRVHRAEERKREAEYQEFEDRRQDLHLILAQQRAERDVKGALSAQKLAELERKQQEAHTAAVEKARLRAQEMQVLVDEYRARKAVEAEAEAEHKRVELVAQEAQLKAQIESSRAHVENRNEAYWQKEETRRRKVEEVQEREVRRRELLAKIAEQCPYWEDLQNVESKLDHVTVAALSSMYHKGEDLTRGHIPMMGFTDKTVIKDSRFKLISALRNAGVSQSEHARVAIARINPQPHLAIHGLL